MPWPMMVIEWYGVIYGTKGDQPYPTTNYHESHDYTSDPTSCTINLIYALVRM